MSELEKLAQNRDAILLAELAGLLHNIGKLDPNFLKSTVNNEGGAIELLKEQAQFVKNGYACKRFAKPSADILKSSVETLLANDNKLDPTQLPGSRPSSDLEKAEQKAAETFNKFYRGIGPLNDSQAQTLSQTIEVIGEKWRLTDLLTLFWDDFFYKPNNKDYQRTYALNRWLKNKQNGLPHLLIHAHGEMSGSEKDQITVDEDTGVIITTGVKQEKSSFDNLRIATAFGYETEVAMWQIRGKQQNIINRVSTLSLKNERWRLRFQATLRHGLGDTQRPINEITLWDYASSIAALFKTSIAKSFLEGQVADANQMHWRLLGVRFDGLDYILQANRMADLLGRQQKFQEVLNQICVALTQDTPIASQVYQDENGLFFVIPDSDKLTLKDLQTLINEQLEQKSFEDIRPCIDWSKNRLRGKEFNLGEEIKRQDKGDRPSLNPEKVEEWWGNSITEICTVCGLRPAISRKTNYCSTCKNNRQSRIQPWLDTFNSTIWLDEVADHNGRLALITGQFHLDPWLNGTLVESLALGMDETTGQPVSKFASFPRVQRVWQTTQTFWQETKNDIKQCLTDNRRRLKIELANAPGLVTHQIYELDLHGQTRMSVLWDGSHLISTDNLSYTAIQLGIKAEDRKTPVVDAALAVGVWFEENSQSMFQLISDDEKNKQFDIQIADVTYQDTAYSTTIPILAEPRTFMALVPADKAVDIIRAIKTKYEREMGKVRNRLPLHVGAVYFQRRTPLRAALEAGKTMLSQKQSVEQVWRVVAKSCHPQTTLSQHKVDYLKDDNQQFTMWTQLTLCHIQSNQHLTWRVPAVMGDGVTEDNWYPYTLGYKAGEGTQPFHARNRAFKKPNSSENSQDDKDYLIHAGDLQAGDQIYFTPATFDFQWLDSSARRFEIAYNEKGCRCNHLNRPYLLDELDEMQAAWGMVQNLSKSQLYALRDLVETKRADWFTNPQESLEDSTFRNFCVDVIRNTQWPKKLLTAKTKEDKKTLPQKTVEQLTNWAINGLLADVVELYLSIMKKDLTGDKSNE